MKERFKEIKFRQESLDRIELCNETSLETSW